MKIKFLGLQEIGIRLLCFMPHSVVYMIAFVPCMSQRAEVGRRASFRRRVGFIELYIVIAIF
jgi:hypothetical protein